MDQVDWRSLVIAINDYFFSTSLFYPWASPFIFIFQPAGTSDYPPVLSSCFSNWPVTLFSCNPSRLFAEVSRWFTRWTIQSLAGFLAFSLVWIISSSLLFSMRLFDFSRLILRLCHQSEKYGSSFVSSLIELCGSCQLLSSGSLPPLSVYHFIRPTSCSHRFPALWALFPAVYLSFWVVWLTLLANGCRGHTS